MQNGNPKTCPPGAIGFNLLSLDFTVEEGGTAPPRQQFKIINVGPPGSILGIQHCKSLVDWVTVTLSSNNVYWFVKVDPAGKAVGEYPFQIEADDDLATNSPQYLPCKLTVTAGPVPPSPLKIVTDSIADGVRGVPYYAEVLAEGGTPPYAWSATGLPGGLSIVTVTGEIIGTPMISGSFFVTVFVVDSEGKSGKLAQTTYLLTIVEPVVNVAITSPVGGEVWYVGDSHDISWVTDRDDGDLKIDLFANGVWTTLATVPIESLKYSWLIGNDALGEGDIIKLAPANGHGGQSDAFAVRQPTGCLVPWLRFRGGFRRGFRRGLGIWVRRS